VYVTPGVVVSPSERTTTRNECLDLTRGLQLQAVKTVYVTTREEFPRCRVDIKASLLSGYLSINPHFIAEVERVTAAELDSYEEKKSRIAQLKQAIYDVWAQKPMSHLKKYETVLLCFRKAEEAKWKARADDLARLEAGVEGAGVAIGEGERTGGRDAVGKEPEEERNEGDGSALGVRKQYGNGNEVTTEEVHILGNNGGDTAAGFGQKGVNTEGVRTIEETTLPGAVLESDSESATDIKPSRAAQLPNGTEQLPGGSVQVPDRIAEVAGRSSQEAGRSAQDPSRVAQEPGRSAHVPGAIPKASETGTLSSSNLAPGSGSFPSEEAPGETQPSCFPAFFSRRRVESAGLATSAPTWTVGRGAVGETTMEKRASSATKWAEVGLFQDRVLEVLRIECGKMQKERDRIIGTTLELIKQFGAVWVENVSRAVLLSLSWEFLEKDVLDSSSF
jgi:hypothetical protein